MRGQGQNWQLPRQAKVWASTAACLVIMLTMSAGGARAAQAEIHAPVTGTPGAAELEESYKTHSMRRNQIARRLSLLWFEEREIKSQYEDSGRSGDLSDFTELASDLSEVRQKIDAARAELTVENRIIKTIGDLIPD